MKVPVLELWTLAVITTTAIDSVAHGVNVVDLFWDFDNGHNLCEWFLVISCDLRCSCLSKWSVGVDRIAAWL